MNDAILWLTVDEAAARARCGVKTIYRAVRSGQLRAVRIGGRRELRFLESWIDDWLLASEYVAAERRNSLGRLTGPTNIVDHPGVAGSG